MKKIFTIEVFRGNNRDNCQQEEFELKAKVVRKDGNGDPVYEPELRDQYVLDDVMTHARNLGASFVEIDDPAYSASEGKWFRLEINVGPADTTEPLTALCEQRPKMPWAVEGAVHAAHNGVDGAGDALEQFREEAAEWLEKMRDMEEDEEDDEHATNEKYLDAYEDWLGDLEELAAELIHMMSSLEDFDSQGPL